MRNLSIGSPMPENQYKENDLETNIQETYASCYSNYKVKSETISTQTYPVIKDVYINQSATYENIIIPFSDGLKILQVVANLEESYKKEGKKGKERAQIEGKEKNNVRETRHRKRRQ